MQWAASVLELGASLFTPRAAAPTARQGEPLGDQPLGAGMSAELDAAVTPPGQHGHASAAGPEHAPQSSSGPVKAEPAEEQKTGLQELQLAANQDGQQLAANPAPSHRLSPTTPSATTSGAAQRPANKRKGSMPVRAMIPPQQEEQDEVAALWEEAEASGDAADDTQDITKLSITRYQVKKAFGCMPSLPQSVLLRVKLNGCVQPGAADYEGTLRGYSGEQLKLCVAAAARAYISALLEPERPADKPPLNFLRSRTLGIEWMLEGSAEVAQPLLVMNLLPNLASKQCAGSVAQPASKRLRCNDGTAICNAEAEADAPDQHGDMVDEEDVTSCSDGEAEGGQHCRARIPGMPGVPSFKSRSACFSISPELVQSLSGAAGLPRHLHFRVTIHGQPHLLDTQARILRNTGRHLLAVSQATRASVNAFFPPGPRGSVKLSKGKGVDFAWSVEDSGGETRVVVLDLRPQLDTSAEAGSSGRKRLRAAQEPDVASDHESDLEAATDCSEEEEEEEEEEQEWRQEAEAEAAASLGLQPGIGSAPRARKKKVTRGRFALSSAFVARLLGAIPTKPRPVHFRVTVRGKPHLQDTQASITSRVNGHWLLVQRTTREAVITFFRAGPNGHVRLSVSKGAGLTWSVGDSDDGTPVVVLDLQPEEDSRAEPDGGAGRLQREEQQQGKVRLGAPVRLNPFAPCEAPIPPAVAAPLTSSSEEVTEEDNARFRTCIFAELHKLRPDATLDDVCRYYRACIVRVRSNGINRDKYWDIGEEGGIVTKLRSYKQVADYIAKQMSQVGDAAAPAVHTPARPKGRGKVQPGATSSPATAGGAVPADEAVQEQQQQRDDGETVLLHIHAMAQHVASLDQPELASEEQKLVATAIAVVLSDSVLGLDEVRSLLGRVPADSAGADGLAAMLPLLVGAVSVLPATAVQEVVCDLLPGPEQEAGGGAGEEVLVRAQVQLLVKAAAAAAQLKAGSAGCSGGGGDAPRNLQASDARYLVQAQHQLQVSTVDSQTKARLLLAAYKQLWKQSKAVLLVASCLAHAEQGRVSAEQDFFDQAVGRVVRLLSQAAAAGASAFTALRLALEARLGRHLAAAGAGAAAAEEAAGISDDVFLALMEPDVEDAISSILNQHKGDEQMRLQLSDTCMQAGMALRASGMVELAALTAGMVGVLRLMHGEQPLPTISVEIAAQVIAGNMSELFVRMYSAMGGLLEPAHS